MNFKSLTTTQLETFANSAETEVRLATPRSRESARAHRDLEGAQVERLRRADARANLAKLEQDLRAKLASALELIGQGEADCAAEQVTALLGRMEAVAASLA